MNDAAWNRLIRQIRDGYVVPVLGPQLLVGPDGRESLQRKIAERLLAMHDCTLDPAALPPFRELDVAVAHLKQADAPLEEIYGDVDAAIQEVTASGEDVIPPPLRELAQISDFRLFVSLTPDGLLARCLRQHRAVNEIVHSPKLPTSEGRDLPADWRTRRGDEAQLLYLFGKSRPAQLFAIHDEDILEYAHNIMSRGSQVPTAFLGELLDRNLLLIGCNFPDWLSRFFLRLTSKDRLSMKAKREWMVEQLEPERSLADFVQTYSQGTQIIAQTRPVDFVAELYQRWKADRDRRETLRAPGVRPEPTEEVPPQPLFFISYSRATDRPRAEAILQALLAIGVAAADVWFDRQSIDPGHDFAQRIIDGIHGCRYFLPLLSAAANGRDEGFVFIEWRKANERKQAMNRDFIVPVIVDADYEPERYTAEPVRAWGGLDFGHAPEGVPDDRLLPRLTALLRDSRRSRELLAAA